jgi:signal transduction histidine kinase
MTPLADTRRIHLKVDRVDATVRLDTDPVKLTQVLMNLVSNAIKFSPEDSDVVISAKVAADTITLAVTDRGIGIAPEDQARIFESFMQVDNSHTRKVGGTGLGLSITKKIVELMHGTLTVRSAMGQGSTFEVVVPRRQPASPASPSTTTA